MHANDFKSSSSSLVHRRVGIPRPNRRERASILARASIEMRDEFNHRDRFLRVRDAHDDDVFFLSLSLSRARSTSTSRRRTRREMAVDLVSGRERTRGDGIGRRATVTRAMRCAARRAARCVREKFTRRVASSTAAVAGARAVQSARHRDGDSDARARHEFDARRRARDVDASTSARDAVVRDAVTRTVAPELVDSHGRAHTYLRISLTERCNLRCGYCMPEEGVELTPNDALLTTDEIARVIRIFARAGVDKVRLTGGEPTVRRDLEEVVRRAAGTPGVRDVSVTTNGVALERRLEGLKASGLRRLNVSLDTLVPAKFEFMTRRRGHERVLRSVARAVELGFQSVKVNCVVTRHQNDDELIDFVNMTKDSPINVRFIEYMPFDGNKWSTEKMVSYAEMRSRIEDAFGPLSRLDDPIEEVAKNFAVPGHVGTVSFVTSMTDAFCGGCNRLRVMADGNLKVCLFGAAETSLRDAMRSGADDDAILRLIGAAVSKKKASHAGMHEIAASNNRAMIKIGG